MSVLEASTPPLSIRIEPAVSSRLAGTDLTSAPFSSVFSDHMFIAEYRDGEWRDARIEAYGPLSLPPNISALQYGVSVFEGLKAQRQPDGGIAMFRPIENAKRINRSAARLSMPPIPETLFMEGLRQLVALDGGWVPAAGDGALYIRPSYFSIDPSVRVKPADRFLFVIFTFPFGTYYAAPVDALVTERYVRAFPGGTGDVKPAGNYAPAMAADAEAQAAGCATVLWLDALERKYVDECGVMNVFFALDRGGRTVIVTPPLGGAILPGVTRDSAIRILVDMGHVVEERQIDIDEVIASAADGSLRECFGTGTAATVSHIRSIVYRGDRIMFPDPEDRPIGTAVRDRIKAIAAGLAEDKFGWLEHLPNAGATS